VKNSPASFWERTWLSRGKKPTGLFSQASTMRVGSTKGRALKVRPAKSACSCALRLRRLCLSAGSSPLRAPSGRGGALSATAAGNVSGSWRNASDAARASRVQQGDARCGAMRRASGGGTRRRARLLQLAAGLHVAFLQLAELRRRLRLRHGGGEAPHAPRTRLVAKLSLAALPRVAVACAQCSE
jgi:hypothetical protein